VIVDFTRQQSAWGASQPVKESTKLEGLLAMLSWTVSWMQKEADEKVTQGATARYLEPL
jgi:hypothetical protein